MAFEKIYANPNNSRNIAVDDMDYVQDDKLIIGSKPSSVMVSSENDLTDLEGYVPGSIAYTAGFADMWQLDSDGNWISLGGG